MARKIYATYAWDADVGKFYLELFDEDGESVPPGTSPHFSSKVESRDWINKVSAGKGWRVIYTN